MKAKPTLRHFLVLAGSSLLAISSAHAATVNWEGDTSATWATAGNWDTAPANSLLTDIANFNLATYDGVTVFAPTVGTATSINGVTIGASNGTMTLSNTAALSIGASGITIANGAGAFTISGSTTLGASQSWTNNSASLFTFGAVTAGANTLTIGGSGDTTASGNISGTNGALTKEGAGLLTLNAANTYTGATTVNGGELRWGVANAIAGGALNVNNGGTVNIQNFTDTVGTITIAQGGTISGTTGTFTTGSLISNNGGTMTGATLLLSNNGSVTYNSTGPGSTTFQIEKLSINDSGTNVFDIADGDAAVDFDITGFVNNGGNNVGRTITKTGAGAMQFSGSSMGATGQNSISLNINQGTVLMNRAANTAFVPGGNALITVGDSVGTAGSAILRFAATGGSEQLGDRPITINSDGLFDLNGKSETTSGALTMNGGSITTGAGSLSLGNATNTFSGASTVTGNLTLSGTAATNLTLGGTTSINGTTTFSGAAGAGITATGSTSIAGTLALGSNGRTIAVNTVSDVLTISANTTGSGTITKTGAGTLQIGDGTNTGTMASTLGLNMGGGTFRILAPTSGGSSQTIASLATTAGTGSIIKLTPGTSGNTTLTITNGTPSTGAGSSLNFDYTAGTTVGGTVGNNYVVWSPTLTAGIIGGAYSVTDSGGTGFATTSGGNVVRLTDSGSAGLPASGGSSTGSYFVGSGYSTVDTAEPGSLVLALSGAVAASNVTVNTTGLSSGANLALGTNLLTLGAGMAFNGPNPYEVTGSGAGGLKAAASGGTIYLNNGTTSTVTISAPIVANGAGGVALNGTGTTILSGVNTYTGATLVGGGTLRVANQLALQNSTLTMNGGTAALVFDSSVVGNAFTFGGLAASASGAGFDIALQNNALTPAAIALTVGGNNATTTYSGALSGSGSLTKAGTGVLLLNSTTSSYSGGTVINAGRLNVASDAALGAADGSITLNGGTLAPRTNTLTGSSGGGAINLTTARNVIVTSAGGGIVANGNNFFTTTGVLSGSGTLTFVDVGGSGGRALNFNATTNDFTGRLVINSNAMTVQVNSLGDTTGAGNIAFNYGGANNGSGFNYGTGATSPLTLDNRAFEFNSGSTMGATLSNANTTHALTINTNLVATGAGTKTLTLSAAAGPTNVFSGNITNGTDGGTVGITKSGAGRWMLSGASNSYTGGTTVSAGTLIITAPANLGNGALNVGANTFIYSPSTAGALNIGSGVLTLSGTIGTAVGGTASQSAITSTGTAVLSGTSGKVNIYGITGVAPTAGVNNLITAGGGLGGGTFTLGTVYNNTNFTVSAISRSGTAISTTVTAATPLSGGVYWKGGLSGNTGVWSASTGLSGGQSNWQTVASGGSNQPLTPGASADLIFSTSTSPGTMAGMTLGANMTVRSVTVNNTATAFGLNNDGYSLTITPASSSSGITIGSGVQASTVAANVVLGTNQTWTNDSTNALTVSGNISGSSVGITKSGTGTIVLSGTNTYTGSTTVSAGTLLINGSASSTSLVTVNNGGTLGGTGTIGSSVTLNDGAFLSPGASIESLATGSNVWNGGSTFVFEFSTDGSTGAAGTAWDLLAITGTLSFGDASDTNRINFDLVTMLNATTAGSLGTWDEDADALWAGFVTTTAGITDFAANLFTIDTTGFGNTLNGNFSIAQNGNNLDLVYTAVPEPRAALLGGLGLLMLLRRRRA